MKLCDFGLAVDHQRIETKQIINPNIDTTYQANCEKSISHTSGPGTPGYIALEVLRGRKYNTKADIYSLWFIAEKLFNADVNSWVNYVNQNMIFISAFRRKMKQILQALPSPNYHPSGYAWLIW